MPITFNPSSKIFKLDTSRSSYIFRVFEQNYLQHLYYGARIPDTNVSHLAERGDFASFSPENEYISSNYSPDLAPMELSCNGCGDFRVSALCIKNYAGNTATDIRYVSHRIFDGKPSLDGLPSTYVVCPNEAQTLEIIAE